MVLISMQEYVLALLKFSSLGSSVVGLLCITSRIGFPALHCDLNCILSSTKRIDFMKTPGIELQMEYITRQESLYELLDLFMAYLQITIPLS